ncbi:MAG: hypothetical protein MZW92_34380 [Comamonadaceae bacterium]|nr:hypothetical protein [Comamonadaceae bacterium]
MVKMSMGQHHGIDSGRVKRKILILDTLYRIAALVHAAIEQNPAYSGAFQQVARAGDLLGRLEKRNRCHCAIASILKMGCTPGTNRSRWRPG